MHPGGEGGEVLVVLDQVDYVRVLGEALRCGFGDVAAEAAWVVSQAGEFGVRGEVGEDRGNGAEVDFEARGMLVFNSCDRWVVH